MSQCQTWLVAHSGTLFADLLVKSILERNDRVALLSGVQLQDKALAMHDSLMRLDFDPKSKPSCESAVADLVNRWGSIHLLVTYAPSVMYVEPIESLSEWQLRDQMESSFFSCLNLIHSVLPFMARQPSGGHIINIVDASGLLATPCLGAPAASLHALEGYCEGLAYDVAKYNVRISTVQCSLPVSLSGTLLHVDQSDEKNESQQPQDHESKLFESLDIITSVGSVSETEVLELVSAIMEIAGSRNPPLRLVAGLDPGVQARDFLSSMTDDFDDFENFFDKLLVKN